MGMALKKDVVHACRKAGTEKPVDLAFLSAQTMGDATLEREVLSLFVAQIPQFLDKVCSVDGSSEANRTAHTLKGAAKSIGAMRLAELAENGEKNGKLDEAAIVAEFERIADYVNELSNN